MLLHIFDLYDWKNVVVSLDDFLKQNTFEIYDDEEDAESRTYSICLSAYKDDSCEQVFWLTFKSFIDGVDFVNTLLAYLCSNSTQDFQVEGVSVRIRRFNVSYPEKPDSSPNSSEKPTRSIGSPSDKFSVIC